MKKSFQSVLCFILWLFLQSQVFAQLVPFIQFKDIGTVSLTPPEQTRFNLISQEGVGVQKHHVKINSIQNYLNGETLTIQNPKNGSNIEFTADYVQSSANGEYYWTGINLDGSTFRLGSYSTGMLGDIYFASSETKYVIESIGPDKMVLIDFPNWEDENNEPCGDLPTADEEGDGGVDDRSGCESNTIRVLVLFTSQADGAGGFDPRIVGPAIVAELNATTGASGLSASDISFTLAAVLELPNFVEDPNDADGDVKALSDNNFANAARNINFADIVLLLTANVYTGIGGIARGISTINKNAYCIAEIRAAATTFTGSHEIGHVIGARHQRCTTCDNVCDATPWNNHGFSIGTTMGTIMYTLPCGNTRVGRWSSETATLMGLQTGNYFNDNAKKLKKRADNVSCFRGSPPPSNPSLPIPVPNREVYITGSNMICYGSDNAYNIVWNPAAFTGNITFHWEHSTNGIGPWTTLGSTNSNCNINSSTTFPSVFYIRATIADAIGSVSDVHRIKQVACRQNGGAEDRTSDISQGVEANYYVYPNPTETFLQITGLKVSDALTISDMTGKTLMSLTSIQLSSDQKGINIGHLPKGLYLVAITNKQQSRTIKISKL